MHGLFAQMLRHIMTKAINGLRVLYPKLIHVTHDNLAHGLHRVAELIGSYQLPTCEQTFSSAEQEAIVAKLNSFLFRGFIEKVDHCSGELISHNFTRPKSEGRIKIILNLNKLNEHSVYEHFKKENLPMALELVEPHCFMGSVDHKDPTTQYRYILIRKVFAVCLAFYSLLIDMSS